MKPARLALVGDFHPDVIAHQGIERSMVLASTENPGVSWEWIHTSSLRGDAGGRLEGFSGIWLVPASPYADEGGALGSVTHARSSHLPFLGTCGGFQHALLEFARSVLGLGQAAHAETEPGAALQIITPLRCSLVDQRGTVHLVPGSRLRAIYAADSAEEGYHCSYGLNPEHEHLMVDGRHGLAIAARDDQGEVRAVELAGHPFFIATLFQPERRALQGRLHPIVRAFIQAASGAGLPPLERLKSSRE